MKFLLALPLLFGPLALSAQSENTPPPLVFSGYVETYYLYDFANPGDHNRPAYVYAFNRHNEVNLNLGFVKAAYTQENVRANLALMAGTYANANLSAEPGVLRNVLEANAGLKISKSNNLWIDAGVFGSHIGFESAISKDCCNLTRSMQADNSPYFETGVKISYTSDNGKWFVSGLLLNGWQRIQRVNGNNTPTFGHQITYKPNDKVTLNSSSFIGNDKPDTLRQMRYFHNLYGIFQVSPKVSLMAGFDFGAEQKAKGSSDYNTWYTPVLMVRFAATDKLSIGLRGEYYEDKNGVIIAQARATGFKHSGTRPIWIMPCGKISSGALRRGDSTARMRFLPATGLPPVTISCWQHPWPFRFEVVRQKKRRTPNMRQSRIFGESETTLRSIFGS